MTYVSFESGSKCTKMHVKMGFKELVNLASKLLILSKSYAEVERLFSLFNTIKSEIPNRSLKAILSIRSRLRRLNDLLRLMHL